MSRNQWFSGDPFYCDDKFIMLNGDPWPCDIDCNENGIPDVCDVDTTNPYAPAADDDWIDMDGDWTPDACEID